MQGWQRDIPDDASLETPPREEQNGQRVTRLMRELIEQAAPFSTSEIQSDSTAVEDILLDMEIDGWRYCLVRSFSRGEDSSATSLSPREREIACMIAKGFPNKMIAGVLDISIWTVGTYLRRIFAKLDVSTRAAMVAKLLDAGLLEKTHHVPHPKARL